MPYCQLHYHFVWRTRASEPLITSRIESQVHSLLWKKALGMGAQVFAVNGMMDDVHMVTSVPPSLAVANFVGKVKGYSSHQVNQRELADSYFRWQEEYGAFSFDRKRLPHFIAYVENQKRHHADGRKIHVLERTEAVSVSEVREPAAIYDLDSSDWRRELEELDRECTAEPNTRA